MNSSWIIVAIALVGVALLILLFVSDDDLDKSIKDDKDDLDHA